MIAILDYGVGNLTAFETIFRRLNIAVEIASSSDQVLSADHLILPGVGSFDIAMDRLNNSGMRDALDNCVLDRRIPLLGVCVGMQMLGDRSDEGSEKGLGYISGNIESMASIMNDNSHWLPHMGWNNVRPIVEHSIWNRVNSRLGFYFLHTYYFNPANVEHIFAVANYGQTFPCAVKNDNIYGFQFHPEKSHSNGVSLLRNFAEL